MTPEVFMQVESLILYFVGKAADRAILFDFGELLIQLRISVSALDLIFAHSDAKFSFLPIVMSRSRVKL